MNSQDLFPMIDSLVSSGFNQTISALHAEAQSSGLISQTVSLDDLISLPLLRLHIKKKEWTKAISLLPRVRLEKSSDLPVLVFLLLIVQYKQDLFNSSLLVSSISRIRRMVDFATSLRLLFKALPNIIRSNYDTVLQSDDKTIIPFVTTSLSIDDRELIDLSFSLNSPTPFSFFETNVLHVASGDNLWSEENITILSELLLIGQETPTETVINAAFVERFLERRLYKTRQEFKTPEEGEFQHFCIRSISLALKENEKETVEAWSCRISSTKLLAAFSSTGVVKVVEIDQLSNSEKVVWCLPNFLEIVRNNLLPLPSILYPFISSSTKSLAVVSSVCWSPCGQFLAIAGERTAVVLFYSFLGLGLEKAKLVAVFECINPIHKPSTLIPETEAIDTTFSNDDDSFYIQAFCKKQIESMDDRSKAFVRKRNTVGISSLVLLPHRLICGSINGGIFVFDLPSTLGQVEGNIYQTSVDLAYVPTHPPVRSFATLAESPTCIAALTSTSTLIILDVSSNDTMTSVYKQNLGFDASSMSSSSDATGKYLLFSEVAVPMSDEERLHNFLSRDDLISNNDAKVIQWCIETESVFATYTGHRNSRNVLEPSFGSIYTKDDVVAVGSETGQLCLWHMQTEETKQAILPFSSIKHSAVVNASAWTRTTDGTNVVVTACDDGHLHVHQFQ